MPQTADIRRQFLALDRERAHLKKRALDLERERWRIGLEREAALFELRVLADRYGAAEWPEDASLAEIVGAIAAALPRPDPAEHAYHGVRLAAPIEQPRATNGIDKASPVHIEAAGRAYRAVCDCGWRSSPSPKDTEAASAADSHEQRLHA